MNGINRFRHLVRVLPLLGLALAAGCETVPVTGRKQFVLVSEGEAASLGASAFAEIRAATPVIANSPQALMVERVGRRILAVVDPAAADWEFVLFEDAEPNAFALPGGKVGVNTGLFRVAGNEAQLAAVIGHEIAHVTARHSAERMSRDLLTDLGLGALSGLGANEQAVGLVAQAATLGVVLPFSRDQESEADRIGVMYMASAGYDPREAIALWHNFASLGGERPPKFFSTHPDPERRIARLEALMPEALALYQRRADER